MAESLCSVEESKFFELSLEVVTHSSWLPLHVDWHFLQLAGGKADLLFHDFLSPLGFTPVDPEGKVKQASLE